MSEILVLVFVIGFGVSFANGANDVSKSIATLVGSGIADYRRAIAWAHFGRHSEQHPRYPLSAAEMDGLAGNYAGGIHVERN